MSQIFGVLIGRDGHLLGHSEIPDYRFVLNDIAEDKIGSWTPGWGKYIVMESQLVRT